MRHMIVDENTVIIDRLNPLAGASRPSWDHYFLDLVATVAKRATCDRGRCACVVVRDRRVLATGYVGSPPGMEHCDDVGHLLREGLDEDGEVRKHCVRTVHAEQNAVAQAARFGQSLEGATFYISMAPCRTCAALILAVGGERVVAVRGYGGGHVGTELLRDARIEVLTLAPAIAYP